MTNHDNTTLPFDAVDPHVGRNTLAGKLAVFFRQHANTWVDGRECSQIAGCYGWRTRISDLRRPPYRFRIENRQRRVTAENGRRFTVSEYKLVTGEDSERG